MLLTTQYLDEAEQLADRIAILHQGRIIANGTLAERKQLLPPAKSASSVDGASAFAYPLIFLPFISSAFVATATMPGPVRAFAEHQPVTPIVNTIRDLYTQQPVSTAIWTALAWCVGILIVAYNLAMATYHRKTA